MCQFGDHQGHFLRHASWQRRIRATGQQVDRQTTECQQVVADCASVGWVAYEARQLRGHRSIHPGPAWPTHTHTRCRQPAVSHSQRVGVCQAKGDLPKEVAGHADWQATGHLDQCIQTSPIHILGDHIRPLGVRVYIQHGEDVRVGQPSNLSGRLQPRGSPWLVRNPDADQSVHHQMPSTVQPTIVFFAGRFQQEVRSENQTIPVAGKQLIGLEPREDTPNDEVVCQHGGGSRRRHFCC